jgi:heme-degrading monooxygenase HmoA
MIVRTWRGRASSTNPDGYPTHFRRGVLPALQRLDGFLGASLLKRTENGEIEFLVLTRWTSIEAIRAFAGGNTGKAVVEPEAVAALVDFDPTVRHYELVEEAVGKG